MKIQTKVRSLELFSEKLVHTALPGSKEEAARRKIAKLEAMVAEYKTTLTKSTQHFQSKLVVEVKRGDDLVAQVEGLQLQLKEAEEMKRRLQNDLKIKSKKLERLQAEKSITVLLIF